MSDPAAVSPLAAAKDAVAYVQKRIDIGASNRPGPGMIARLLCVGGTFTDGEMRKQVSAELSRIPNPTNRDRARVEADWAKHYGCGNCGEQSALAFEYLRQQGVRPLDWMHVDNFRHAFVVIGRPAGTDPNDYDSWGKDRAKAAICDPWAGRAEPALYLDVWNWNGRMKLLLRED